LTCDSQRPEGTWAGRVRVLQRPLMVLLLLSLNGALGTVDRNLHDAQARHGTAGLHWWSWLAIVTAAFLTVLVFAFCDDPDADGDGSDVDLRLREWLWVRLRHALRPFSSVDERVKHFSDERIMKYKCDKNRDGEPFRFSARFHPNVGVLEDITPLQGDFYNGYDPEKVEEVSDALREAEETLAVKRP